MLCEQPFQRGDRRGQPKTGTIAGYRAHRDSREQACEPCLKAWRLVSRDASRKWRANNPEKSRLSVREARRKYYHKDVEASRQHGKEARLRRRTLPGSVTVEELEQLFNDHFWSCFYCLAPLHRNKNGKFPVDHVVPISNPDCTNDIMNLVPCCINCNVSKKDRNLQDWDPASYERWKRYVTSVQIDMLLE